MPIRFRPMTFSRDDSIDLTTAATWFTDEAEVVDAPSNPTPSHDEALLEVVFFQIEYDGTITQFWASTPYTYESLRNMFREIPALVAFAILRRESPLNTPIVDKYYQGCASCRKPMRTNEVVIPPTSLCEECRHRNIVCELCRQARPRGEFTSQTNVPICAECRGNHSLTRCLHCSRYFHTPSSESSYEFCPQCREYMAREEDRLRERGGIRDYGYKPNPQFLPEYKPNELYLGVELETDKYPHGDTGIAGVELMKSPLFDKHFYMKRDGSLERGIEIVTHPATLQFHKEQFGWTEIIAKVRELGGKSHYTSTCGLHIHFNENFLGKNREERDARAITLCFLFEKFWKQMLKFSRREPHNALTYASPHREKFRKMTNEQFAYLKGHVGRHHVVNLNTHQPTIEIRIFRGTLNEPTLFASLELVDFLVRLVVTHTPAFIYRLTWDKLMSYIIPAKYPNLEDYVRWKKLKEGEPKCVSSLESKED